MRIVVFLLSLIVAVGSEHSRRLSSDKEYREINTSNGKVRGQRTHHIGYYDQYGFSYLGIPFAKPPLGKLRYKKPQPAEPWEGTLNANDFSPACIQYSKYPYPWYDQKPGISEDCLYLNIYTPYENNTYARPVIFFIHGGGFQGGSSRMEYYSGVSFSTDWEFDPFVGAPAGAVVVTINYRLGALGFFTTGTEDAPGNVGIYDMVMALNWVNKNIDVFNGDPDRITLYGQGAGAIAVSLLCVSPMTEGLFQAAIMNSGTFVSFKKNRNRDNIKISRRLAKSVGCTSENVDFFDNPKEVVTCLQGTNATLLAVTLNSFDPDDLFILYPQYDGEILPHDPVKNLKEGKVHDVPILLAASFTEGSFLLTTKYPEVFGRFGEIDQGINWTFAKSILNDAFKSYPEPEEISKYFLNGVDPNDEVEIRRRTAKALGTDRIFCPIYYFGEKYGDSTRKAYMYIFEFIENSMPWAKWMESVHFNDAPYLFSSKFHVEKTEDINIKDDERYASFFIRSIVISFARDLAAPGENWPYFGFQSNSHGYTEVSDKRFNPEFHHLPTDLKPYEKKEKPPSVYCEFLRKYHGF